MSETLKPCPFCGGPASVDTKNYRKKPIEYRVGCDLKVDICCAGFRRGAGYWDVDRAIYAWNRRAPTASPDIAPSKESRA